MTTTTKPAKTETDYEIEFITNLGKYSEQSRNISREQLLCRYLTGAQKRTDWGGINKARVIAFAESEFFNAQSA